MPNQLFEENLAGHLRAIQLCLENHLRLPAVTLIYTGIDVVSNLGRPEGKEQANRHDFEARAEKYMACVSRLGVSGRDLYAARCGVVHSYTFNSRLSRNQEARRIIYAWGCATTDKPNAILSSLGF